MAKVKPPKGERLLPKLAFLSAITVLAVGAGLGIVYVGMQNSAINPMKASDLRGSFASAYGVQDITQEQGDTTGVDSTSVKFKIKPSDDVPVSYSIQYVGEAISNFRSDEVVNVLASGAPVPESKDKDKAETDAAEEAASKFNFDFYAASKDDYKNGSFKSINNVFENLYNLGADSVSLTSTPTIGGGRSNDVTIRTTGYSYEQSGLENLWNSAVNAIGEEGNLDGNTVYKVKIINTPENKEGVSGEVSSLFYNKATFDKARDIDPKIWNNIRAYTDTNFQFLGLKGFKYYESLNPTESKMTLNLSGKQPDSKGINSVVEKFTEAALDTEDVWYNGTYITSFRYENSTDDAWTQYSSNIVN